ncbi:MAG: hypothetical protein LBE08_00430 [Bifidobacteriaceae bacterium]|jgi:hypothetical protein|nr:hypothetical protein [Bifidobacteriaceae bacterium]
MNKLSRKIGLIAVAGAMLAGCNTDGDVATLDGRGGTGATNESQQAVAAEQFADCLTKAGVPVTLEDQGDGQKAVWFDTEEPTAEAWGDGSTGWSGGAGDQTEAAIAATYKRLADLVEPHSPSDAAMIRESAGEMGGGAAFAAGGGEVTAEPVYLIIGETDYTEAFARCLDESGYTQPVYHVDPAQELRDKQLVAQASTEWAECAREHGFPDLKDPDPPVADEYVTYPSIILPNDITEEALRALLEACPNFDEEKMRAYDAAVAAMPEDASEDDWYKLSEQYNVTSPSIEFDWEALSAYSSETIDPATQAELERMNRLSEIIWEKQNAYYDSH